jgi:hypothetical protein
MLEKPVLHRHPFHPRQEGGYQEDPMLSALLTRLFLFPLYHTPDPRPDYQPDSPPPGRPPRPDPVPPEPSPDPTPPDPSPRPGPGTPPDSPPPIWARG